MPPSINNTNNKNKKQNKLLAEAGNEVFLNEVVEQLIHTSRRMLLLDCNPENLQ